MNAHDTHADGHGPHDFAHPMPVKTLLAVFFALVFLTVLTVAQAQLHLGSWEVWISLFIATIKASLVMWFFMHLQHDKPFNRVVFFASFLFVALFLGFTLMDRAQYEERLELQPPKAAAM